MYTRGGKFVVINNTSALLYLKIGPEHSDEHGLAAIDTGHKALMPGVNLAPLWGAHTLCVELRGCQRRGRWHPRNRTDYGKLKLDCVNF